MKLADIIETFISGDWGEETVAEDTPNSVFCIRGADIVPITNHCFNGIPQRFVCDKTIENKTLKAGDLIIEKSGGSPTQSTGRIVYVSEDLIKAKGNVVCSNFCTAFRVKTGWNPLYVYYYWQNVYNHGAFFNFEGKTTGIKNLQLDNALSAIDIEYLPLEKQDQIVASLASIDEKIKVNRQINDNLEAMAKQLYDYWFVQFDFPNENGRPYKSSGGMMVWNEKLKREIPQGWNDCKIKDFMRIFTGKKDVSKAVPGNYKFFSCAPEPISSNEYIYDGYAVLVSGNGSYTGRVGFYKGKFDLYQRTYACVLDKDEHNISFFYYTLRYLFQPIYSGGKHGSSIPYIVLGDLADFCFAFNETICTKFVDAAKPMFDEQLLRQKEIEALTKQRDELLPLLMNGQVSVNSD